MMMIFSSFLMTFRPTGAFNTKWLWMELRKRQLSTSLTLLFNITLVCKSTLISIPSLNKLDWNTCQYKTLAAILFPLQI